MLPCDKLFMKYHSSFIGIIVDYLRLNFIVVLKIQIGIIYNKLNKYCIINSIVPHLLTISSPNVKHAMILILLIVY
jgi:hypothetical protein